MLVESVCLLSFNVGLFVLQTLLFLTSLFLIMLVLVQRGKGGGLTGALGGMGGQSAFGSRAGDAFTKITIVTAVIWITLCMITIARYNPPPAPKTVAESIQARGGMATSVGEAEDQDSEDLDTDSGDLGSDLELPSLPDEASNNLLDFGLSDDDSSDENATDNADDDSASGDSALGDGSPESEN